MGKSTVNQNECVRSFPSPIPATSLIVLPVSSLEDAILKALSSLLPHLAGTTNNPRTEFYNKFKREADEHDGDFVKKHGGNLDITLIFVSPSLFPSVPVAGSSTP